MKDDPRRNTSSDAMDVAQMRTLAIKEPLRKALAIGMCLISIRGRRKHKISKEKLLSQHYMHCSYFSGRIYVERTIEQCNLGYHNTQKAEEGCLMGRALKWGLR